MTTEQLIKSVMTRRTGESLHVVLSGHKRPDGLPADPFHYYPSTLAQRDRFIAKHRALGHKVEVQR